MSLRPIRERVKTVNVDGDLRGLSSIVRDHPPQYELHIHIHPEKEADVRSLASKRRFHAATSGVGFYLTTPESIAPHEQAVWHFFLVCELMQHNLISSAEVHMVQPTEEILMHKMNRKHIKRAYVPTHVVSFDASVALYMMMAGYWKNHFSEEVIKKEVQKNGYSTIHLDRATLAILHNEILTANRKVEKEGFRNAT
jgi:hypothetical protein